MKVPSTSMLSLNTSWQGGVNKLYFHTVRVFPEASAAPKWITHSTTAHLLNCLFYGRLTFALDFTRGLTSRGQAKRHYFPITTVTSNYRWSLLCVLWVRGQDLPSTTQIKWNLHLHRMLLLLYKCESDCVLITFSCLTCWINIDLMILIFSLILI